MVEETPANDPSPSEPIRFEMDSTESWRRVAHVRIAAAHMESSRDAVARELQKNVRMDGFRKGKVPLETIRRQYASQIEQDALEKLIPDAYREILAAHDDLHPVSDPTVEDLKLEEGEPVCFDLVIEVRPEIEIGGLSSIEVTRILPPVTEEQVQKALEDLRERHAKWAPVEATEAAREGDALLIDYVPFDANGEPQPQEKVEGHTLELGSKEILPEFNAALQGLQAGEDTDVEVNYPVDFPNEDLRGSTRTVHVELREIRHKELAELDDAFAAEHGSFGDLPALRDDLRRRLEEAVQRESDRQFREQLIDKIIEVNDVPIPRSLEARYLQAMLRDLEQQGQEKLDEERRNKLAAAYKPLAGRAVQRLVILDTIRRSQGIGASEDQVQARMEKLAAEQGVSPEEFRAAVERAGNLDRLRSDLEEEMCFAWLEGQVKVTISEEIPARETAGDMAEAAPSRDQAMEDSKDIEPGGPERAAESKE